MSDEPTSIRDLLLSLDPGANERMVDAMRKLGEVMLGTMTSSASAQSPAIQRVLQMARDIAEARDALDARLSALPAGTIIPVAPDTDAPPPDEPPTDAPSVLDSLALQALTDPEAALALADHLLDRDETEEAEKATAWAEALREPGLLQVLVMDGHSLVPTDGLYSWGALKPRGGEHLVVRGKAHRIAFSPAREDSDLRLSEPYHGDTEHLRFPSADCFLRERLPAVMQRRVPLPPPRDHGWFRRIEWPRPGPFGVDNYLTQFVDFPDAVRWPPPDDIVLNGDRTIRDRAHDDHLDSIARVYEALGLSRPPLPRMPAGVLQAIGYEPIENLSLRGRPEQGDTFTLDGETYEADPDGSESPGPVRWRHRDNPERVLFQFPGSGHVCTHRVPESAHETGAASLTRGSRLVRGHGTAWAQGPEALVPGQRLLLRGRPYTVATVEDDERLTLQRPYRGAGERLAFPGPEVRVLPAPRHRRPERRTGGRP